MENSASLARAIIHKINEEASLLLARNWPDIGRILNKDQELAIGAKILISDRKASPGEQPDKDSRIKVTISFAEKYSDSIEADLPDPSQPELDMK